MDKTPDSEAQSQGDTKTEIVTIDEVNPKIRLGKRNINYKPRKHFMGNSVEEGTHPNVLRTRENFRKYRLSLRKPDGSLAAPAGSGRKKNVLGNVMREALSHTVTVNGKRSDMTVAEVIVQQRLNEAMRSAHESDVALAATELVFDRTEGKPKGITEVSGPDGGPIEKVETNVVLAKLFS
jgi:hypothetical protein